MSLALVKRLLLGFGLAVSIFLPSANQRPLKGLGLSGAAAGNHCISRNIDCTHPESVLHAGAAAARICTWVEIVEGRMHEGTMRRRAIGVENSLPAPRDGSLWAPHAWLEV